MNLSPFCTLLAFAAVSITAAESPGGNAVIHAQGGLSAIVIKTSSRTAGAINSLTWNDREFLDCFDHGRELQSASNLDFGSAISAETFNPTEAGSRDDGRGNQSSSQLLFLRSEAGSLQTVTRMTFWLAPGEKSG